MSDNCTMLLARLFRLASGMYKRIGGTIAKNRQKSLQGRVLMLLRLTLGAICIIAVPWVAWIRVEEEAIGAMLAA